MSQFELCKISETKDVYAFCLLCVCFEIFCWWISAFPIAGHAVYKPEVCKWRQVCLSPTLELQTSRDSVLAGRVLKLLIGPLIREHVCMCVWSFSIPENSIQPSCLIQSRQPPSVLPLDTTVINVLSSKALLRRIKHQHEFQRGQGICTDLTIFDISMVTLCFSVSSVVFLLISNYHLLGNILLFVVVNTDLVPHGAFLSVKKEINWLWRLWVVFTVGSHFKYEWFLSAARAVLPSPDSGRCLHSSTAEERLSPLEHYVFTILDICCPLPEKQHLSARFSPVSLSPSFNSRHWQLPWCLSPSGF